MLVQIKLGVEINNEEVRDTLEMVFRKLDDCTCITRENLNECFETRIEYPFLVDLVLFAALCLLQNILKYSLPKLPGCSLTGIMF